MCAAFAHDLGHPPFVHDTEGMDELIGFWILAAMLALGVAGAAWHLVA